MSIVVKNLPAIAGDARDSGWIPGYGRSPGEGNGNHSSILAWRIPWTEEPGGLQFTGSQRVGHNCVTNRDKHEQMLVMYGVKFSPPGKSISFAVIFYFI